MATPTQQRALGRLRPPLAHMAYRIGQDSALLRKNLPIKRQEGLLVISDGQAPHIDQSSTLCDAVMREMGRHNYQGVLLDFEQTPTPDRQSFALALSHLLHSHKKTLYLPPCYHCPQATVLIDTAISGGSFHQYLQESKQRYGAIALDLQRLQMDFLLPAPHGIGTPLSHDGFLALRQRHGGNSFFSQELCTRYFTYQDQGETHFVLYDDGETMVQKMRIGASLGVQVGICVYQEVEDLLGVLFGKR